MKRLYFSNKPTKFTLLDDWVYEQVKAFTWSCDKKGYVYTTLWRHQKRIRVHLHHVVCWRPKGLLIDHANQLKADNRLANLRVATFAQNAVNSRLFRTNTSGYRGVTFNQPARRWQASIRIDGRTRADQRQSELPPDDN